MQPETVELDVLATQLQLLWREALTQSDALVREAHYGPQLSLLMSDMRMQLELLQEAVLKQHAALVQYAQDAPALLQRPVTLYQELHVKAQQLTDHTPTPLDGVTRAAVPLDPHSMLCTVQCDDVFPGVVAQLQSENESVIKYAPSSTLARRHVTEKLEQLWQFWTQQCDALYDTLEEPSPLDTTSQSHAVTNAVLTVTRHLVDEAPPELPPQATRLHNLLATVVPAMDALVEALRDEQQSCQVMRDNVLARLACCAQLYSNLTKPYRLHQSRLLPGGHASIF
jgi:hypothetical protein